MTKEILQARDSGRRMWKMVEKLKGSNKKREQEKAIYDQNGKLLQEREEEQAMMRYWRTVYQKVENQMKQKWMEGEGDIYATEKEAGEESDLATIVWDERTREQVAPVEIGEHMHMLNAEIRREEEGKIRITYRLGNYETKFNVNLREHMDMLKGRIEMPQLKSYMENTKMEQQEVKKVLWKFKDGKQPV